MRVFVLVILGVYLTLVTLMAVSGHFVGKIITKRNMLMTVFAVVVTIAFTYIYLGQHQPAGIYGVAGGLFGISAIALNNGIAMHQRPNVKHHVIRMLINIVFLVFLYMVK
ncbi:MULTISPECIES: hypothetical protein [Streptococcus]|uniref:Uncharacterized protein n=1 Tax=Streptococcus caledonicus TaxID=2614158 RepID=A0ABW0UDJ0_9STRE|nr:hypothetical protein [Streptococcus sp. S784/96/1]